GQPDTGADIYNLEACKSTEEIWLLEGEPDVWIASQAGIAAVSLTCGAVQHATNRMQRGLEELVASGVRVVNICYDNDDAGRITAEVVGRMLAQKGIDARIRLLSSPLVPEKGDITDLYRQIAQDDTALRLALDQLPVQICKAEDDSSREKALIPGEWASPLALREHDVPEFPVESLPGWLSAMVAEVARVTQTPTDLGATFALAVLSTVWSRRVVAEVHPFWREPVNLYLLVAAESGARKSAVYRHFVSPVSEFERALQEELQIGRASCRERGEAWVVVVTMKTD